ATQRSSWRRTGGGGPTPSRISTACLPSRFFIRGQRPIPNGCFLPGGGVGRRPSTTPARGAGFDLRSDFKPRGPAPGLGCGALNFYLALGYVPDEFCIRSGVFKLPPAHAGYLDVDSSKLATWRYWTLPKNSAAGDVDGESLADRAGELLLDSVRIRLRSDVPV